MAARPVLSISAVKPKRVHARVERPRGRYDGGRGAYMPANGLATSASPRADTATAAVPDPAEPELHLQATVNRRVDVLEMERSHGRIDEPSYCLGRIAQAIFERSYGRSGSAWSQGDRVDAAVAHELAIIHAIEDAHTVRAYQERIERAIGTVGARFLRRVLCEGETFAGYASARGKGGKHGTTMVAEHFRILLESLVEAWAARGKAAAHPKSKDDREAWAKTIRAYRDPGADETDERGRVVQRGKGYRWGRVAQQD